jgi:hypothetical protein
MTRRRVVASGLEYDFAGDDAPLLAERDWALATAQLLDDITATPLTVPFTARVVLPGAPEEIAQDGTRVRRTERGIAVKHGPDGTFALVARPWLRFTPFGSPATVTVAIEAPDFSPLSLTFPVVYDVRTVAGPANTGATVVSLNSTAGLTTGQTLLFGPASAPRYLRIRSIGAGNQVTLESGLATLQNVGDPVFPDAYSSPPTVVAAMRRRPVIIAGRVVTRDTAANTSTPVVNASITVTDFWRTRAAVVANPANGSMTHPVPVLREFAGAISPGALAARPVAAGLGAAVLPSAGDDRTLDLPASADARRIDVRRRQNLLPAPAPLPARLLLVEADDPDASEYHTIATLDPPGAPDEPARLGLELPLARAHREGARVARLNPGVLPPPAFTLVTEVLRGDRCLFIDAPIGAPPPSSVRIAGGGPADEFQACAVLEARSNPEGYFRLPPIHRMARVQLTVDDGLGNVLPPIEIDPQYGEPEQRIDAVFFV